MNVHFQNVKSRLALLEGMSEAGVVLRSTAAAAASAAAEALSRRRRRRRNQWRRRNRERQMRKMELEEGRKGGSRERGRIVEGDDK